MERISWKPWRGEPSHERGTWQILSFISVKIFRFDVFLLSNMMMFFFPRRGFLMRSSGDKFVGALVCLLIYLM